MLARIPILAALALAAWPATRAQAADAGGLFSAVIWTSDYRFQGISNTDRRPALQGYVHWWRPDGFYAGLFATEVHYYDGGPRLELDAYAGKTFALDQGRSQLKAEVMYTSFPRNPTPGPTFDFVQVKGEAQRRAGRWTLLGSASFTPQASYGAGEAWLAQAQADYAVAPRLTLRAQAGRRWVHRGADRTFWSLGASRSLGGTAQQPRSVVALRYESTNLAPRACGFNPRICGPELIGSVTLNLPPLMLGRR